MCTSASGGQLRDFAHRAAEQVCRVSAFGGPGGRWAADWQATEEVPGAAEHSSATGGIGNKWHAGGGAGGWLGLGFRSLRAAVRDRQPLSGACLLASAGKELRVAVICQGENEKVAKDAGAGEQPAGAGTGGGGGGAAGRRCSVSTLSQRAGKLPGPRGLGWAGGGWGSAQHSLQQYCSLP